VGVSAQLMPKIIFLPHVRRRKRSGSAASGNENNTEAIGFYTSRAKLELIILMPNNWRPETTEMGTRSAL